MAKWQGTVVPNSGYVEKVYFNTNLSVEEVVSILSSLEYNEIGAGFILASEDLSIIIAFSYISGTYGISNGVTNEIYFTSDDLDFGYVGWNPAISYPLIINNNVVNSFQMEDNNFVSGTQNNLITELFSTTPFTQSQQTTADKLQKLIDGKQYVIDKTNAKAGTDLKINSTWQSIGDIIEGITGSGSSGIVIPPVSNLVVSDKGVASWSVPTLSLPNEYEYTLSYLVKVNGKEIEELTTTSIDLSTYLVGGTNIISVIVKATITDNNESSINYEYSKPRYEIVTLSTTLPSKISSAGSGIVGTNIYLFGGSGNAYNTLKFDTTTETITTLEATFTQYIHSIKCIVNGTNIYLFGGGLYGSQNRVNTIYKFDSLTETLTTLNTTLPTNLSKIGIAKIESNVYIFGGATDSGVFTNKIYKFDLTNETITTLETTLPINIYEIEAKAIGTNIYLFGGITDSSVYINTIYKFDSLTETLSTLDTTLPTNACDIGSALIGTNIYLFGGETSTITNLKTILKFDTTNETLSTLETKLPINMADMVVEVIEKEAYILGGRIDRSSTNSILKFIE